MSQIILIILCRNGRDTCLHQLSSENQYNYVVQADTSHTVNDLISAWGTYWRGALIREGHLFLNSQK